VRLLYKVCCRSTSALGQDFIADCNIINCSLLWQCVRSCVLCVQVAKVDPLSMMSQRHRSVSHTMETFTPSTAVDNYTFFLVQQKLNFKEHA